VPSEEAEDGRNLNRELEVLRKERNMHRNRIYGLLIQQGIQIRNPSSKEFLNELESLQTLDGKELSPDFKDRLEREYKRLKMVEEQKVFLKKEREKTKPSE
jgi:transposase